jgi:hypothetical protein
MGTWMSQIKNTKRNPCKWEASPYVLKGPHYGRGGGFEQ